MRGLVLRFVGTLLAFGLGTMGSADAGEFYYMIIFGSQSHPKQLRFTHTWATFIKATGEGTDPNGYTIETNTISWLPATLDVKVWTPIPEKGVNLDLNPTLKAVYANHENVMMWGPFIIQGELYHRSISVRNTLESGQLQYRAISNSRNLLISDCIHALAGVDPVLGRNNYPLFRIGKPASRHMAREIMMRSAFNQYCYENSWLTPRLGLDRVPVDVVSPQEIPKRDCFLCILPD